MTETFQPVSSSTLRLASTPGFAASKASKAASVGAKTVKGPSALSASTRPAVVRALMTSTWMSGNSSGGDIGSSIGTVHFIQCDFDGDGVRDVPTYKEAPAQAGYGSW